MIEKRPFGRTGHMSSVIIFGAAALGSVTQVEADETLDQLLEYGINHIDTAASYGNAEERIGPWMAQHRKNFFLATKTGERSYGKARNEIHQSLARLRVDSFDLIQLHNLGHPDEWDEAMGDSGALKAAIEARQEGLVRFIGVTGHGLNIPAFHLRSLNHFDFDSVLLPYNFVMKQDNKYISDFEALLKLCAERKVAVQTIKSITCGPWGSKNRTSSVWYEPLTKQPDIDLAVHWVLGRSNIFLNSAGDIHLLPRILDAANRFQSRPSDTAMSQLVEERHMSSLFA
jgi:aryl-alcohol dehydrogenase-like predicted oxidoreductase